MAEVKEHSTEVNNGNIKQICSFFCKGRRKQAYYVHKTAGGFLKLIRRCEKTSYLQLDIDKAKCMADIKELIQLIVDDKIPPKLDKIGSETQLGLSYEELRKAHDILLLLLKKVEEERDKAIAENKKLDYHNKVIEAGFSELNKKRSDEIKRLDSVVSGLDNKSWPYVSASETAGKINDIIHGSVKLK